LFKNPGKIWTKRVCVVTNSPGEARRCHSRTDKKCCCGPKYLKRNRLREIRRPRSRQRGAKTVSFFIFSIEILSFSIEILSFFIETLGFSIEITTFSIEIMSFSIKIMTFSIEILSFSIKIMTFSIETLGFL